MELKENLAEQLQLFIVNSLITKYQVSEHDAVASAILDDLDVDSLTVVELSLLIEREFGIIAPDSAIRVEQSIREAAISYAELAREVKESKGA